MVHQLDAEVGQRVADAWVAQGRKLDLALARVAGAELGVAVAGMADQLGNPDSDLGFENARHAGNADVLGMALARPLSIEGGEDVNRRVAAQRDAPAPRQIDKAGQKPGGPVDIAMGIDVARRTPHELDETVCLARKFLTETRCPATRSITGFECYMKAHAQRRRRPGEGRGLGA